MLWSHLFSAGREGLSYDIKLRITVLFQTESTFYQHSNWSKQKQRSKNRTPSLTLNLIEMQLELLFVKILKGSVSWYWGVNLLFSRFSASCIVSPALIYYVILIIFSKYCSRISDGVLGRVGVDIIALMALSVILFYW